jgi:hypothetical protein
MTRASKKNPDLATMFQAVSGNLATHRSSLNQADEYNHNHGDNMVEIFGVINEAIEAKRDKKPAEQLAYASQLLEQRSQSGSAKMYASGLAQASQQFKGKTVTTKNVSSLLGSLLGGLASGQTPSNVTSDLLSSLLGGGAGGQGSGSQPSSLPTDLLASMLSGTSGGQGAGSPPADLPTDLLGSLLGGAAGGQGVPSQASSTPADLLGSLLGGTGGGPSSASQQGLDMGDLLNAGMAFMNSQQQGESTLNSIIKAFVAATQAGQTSHRAQSGEVVANTIIQMLAKQSGR